jgi:hypothetical protein
VPVIRSGTFLIHGFIVDTLGTGWFFNPTSGSETWYCTLLGPAVPTSYVALSTFALLDTTTEGINLPWNPSPPGFTPTTNCRIHPAVGGISGASHSTGTIQYSSIFFSIGDPDPDADKFEDNPAYGDLFSFLRITIDSHGLDAPFESTNAAGTQSAVTVTGNYDIVYYWWTIPDKDACKNEHDSQLQLLPAEETPDEPWERLDPDDPDAAPTPVVDTVEPNHGLTVGGTAVVIKGSGFGIDATVKFGLSSATSVVVVNQYRIECVSPAHAAGGTTVVVTNADGVSS